ncbi:hypothetical protein JNW89_20680, partial [Micromonospora sp. 4G55]|nr:hypothetical protein [Micromonospora sp. 4G55]
MNRAAALHRRAAATAVAAAGVLDETETCTVWAASVSGMSFQPSTCLRPFRNAIVEYS